MIEFDKKQFKKLVKDNGYNYKSIANILTDSYGIPTVEQTIKSWMLKNNAKQPDYEKTTALADLFGIPSLHLFVDGERELEKNIKLAIQKDPEHYSQYFKKDTKSAMHQEILDILEAMEEEKLTAILTIIKGLK